jgi:leader peptidase (prepilin peptidase) / N-methyltransferase
MSAELLTVLRILPALAGVTGLAIGSFLNVVVHRVPRRLSVLRPASACPGCGSAIAPRDNVPVLSWLLLAGRCRTCRIRIPARYPLVEALTAAAFVAVALRFAPSGADLASIAAGALTLLAFLWLTAASIALTAVDLELRRLPNRIVLPSLGVGAVLLGAAAALSGNGAAGLGAVGGAAGSFALFLALALLRPGGMGMGDVKLSALLGLHLGYLGLAPLLVGLFAAFLLGGLAGLALVLAGRGSRKTAIPFGPWMFAGAAIGIFAGDPLADAYLSLAGLN